MSGFMRKAALVVGAVALVATTAGLAAPAVAATATTAATAGGIAGISAATLAAIGTYGGLAAGVLSAISAATAPGMSNQGSQTSFQTNPQSGLPYAMGRTRMSGLRIYADTNTRPGYTKFNDLLWFGAMLSIGGQIEEIEKFTVDNELVTFDGSGNAVGNYHDYMGQKLHMGGPQASALALTLGGGSAPGWTSQHRLSGITHAMWCLRYNKQGEMFGAGAPEPAWIGKWVRVYDPRLDSTYPGGSGPCRALNETTYVWSQNPGLHALTWALGRWQNGKRTCGIGAPVDTIRVADFVECANVCDANQWKVGGVEWTTDSKWDTFKRILQAGGARPTKTGAMIGCIVSTPRTAVATIESWHLLDGLSIAATKSRRDRFNSVIPRYVDEDSDWSVISGKAITVPEYVTADRGQRTKEIDYPLVQVFSGEQAKQPGQLAAYDIVNSREAGPIDFTTGPEWIGLKTGDVVLLNVPEEGLDNQPILIVRRAPDPATGKVSFSAQTETMSKHPFALGQTTSPPTPFSLKAPDLKPPAPVTASWAATGSTTGEGLPAIIVTGESDMPSADAVLIDYRKPGEDAWTRAAIVSANEPVQHVIAPLESDTSYQVRIGYRVEQIDGDFIILSAVTGTGKLSGIEDGATVGATPEQVSQLSQLAADIAAAETLVNSIQTQVDGDLASMQAQVTAVQGAMSALETSVQQDIQEINEEIAGINPSATPNLLDNGGFENNLVGWGGDTGWTVGTSPTHGVFVYRIAPASGTFVLQKTVPALAGSTYTLAADLLLTASSGVVYVDMQFMNDANTVLLDAPQTNAPAGTDFSTADTNRKLYKCTATAPAGTTKVACRFVVSGVTGLTVAAVRRMKLELGDKATSYSADASAFTAYTTAYSASGQVASLTSTVSTLNGTVSSQATSISSLTSGLSTLQNLVTASSSPNLLKNGGFENGLLGWTPNTSPGWTSAVSGNWGRIAQYNGTVADNDFRYLESDLIPVFASTNITLAADALLRISGGTGSTYLRVVWFAADGTTSTGSQTGPARASDPGQDFDTTMASRSLYQMTALAPAGTTYARVQLIAQKVSGTFTVVCWRQVKVERGTVATPYSGEASAAQMFTAYSDLNSSFATLSSTVSSQGSSISTLQTAMTNANGNIATLTNTLNASSNPNLMDNGGFENGLTGWVSNVSGWNIANNGTWGTYAYRQGDFTGTAYMFKDVSGIAPGWPYTITCDPNVAMSSGTYSLLWQIQWMNSSNAVISSVDGPVLTGSGVGFINTGANRAAIKTTGTAPAGTVWARFVLYFNKLSGTMIEIDMRQVKLEIGSIATPFSSEATIKSIYTVANTATSSVASLTTTVNTQGSSISTLQSAMSAAQGDVATLKSKVTTGSGNLLPNSSFSQSGWPAGWDWYSPFPGSYLDGPIRDLAGNDWRPGGNFGALWGEHNFGLKQTNGNTGDWGQLHSQRVPVQGNKWYSFEMFVACHRANNGIKIEWYDAANNFITVSGSTEIAVGTGGTNINGWTNRYVKGQAPGNAAFAVCVCYKLGTYAGQGDSYMWLCRPMLIEVDANYVGPSAYTPSGDRASIEVMQQSVNGILAKYGVTLDVNNYITGFQQLNNGATGSFIINADYFAIVKPGGGVRTEYSAGNWRAYDGSGVLRARWGVW